MDSIMTFTIEGAQFRGNYIACDSAVQQIIELHNYPALVNRLLSQTITLAFALSNTIKYDGIFALQLKGKGAIKTVFVSVTSDKQTRAYCVFDEEKIKTATFDNKSLFGNEGLLLFSVSEIGKEPYQGVVEIVGDNLTDTVLNYFNKSEQILTDIVLRQQGDKTRVIMLQQMPLKQGFDPQQVQDMHETAQVLLHSVKDSELFDEALAPEKLLYRLFHANDLVVYNPQLPVFFCPCYQDKMYQFLKNMNPAERDELFVDGVITTECQFCGKKYTFTPKDFK